MLQEIEIKNFKSILTDKISLGRVNVFIGENGCGKTNILEAIATLSAVKGYNLNINGLSSKGVRVTKPLLTMSSFIGLRQKNEIEVSAKFASEEESVQCNIYPVDKNDIYSEWKDEYQDFVETKQVDSKEYNNIFDKIFKEELNKISNKIFKEEEIDKRLNEGLSVDAIKEEIKTKFLNETKTINKTKFINNIKQKTHNHLIKINNSYISDFLIFNLNTQSLRGIINNSKEIPLGINGEGLDVLLHDFSKEEWNEIKEYSYLISWLDEIIIDNTDSLKYEGHKLGRSASYLYFKDKHMRKNNNIFAAENSNEGVLNVLFYLALIISKKTPSFFAIDNIDASLNPHLCQHLMSEICTLTKKHNKQILITTHNPAILDGLNLSDDEVRLFEVKRLDNGSTKTRRINFKPDVSNEQFKLSELWTRGFLGAISQNF